MPTGVRKHLARGFALPTILIASIVMLIVLLASVSSTAAVRNAILNQYYSQLALTAGEAGVEYAKACLNQNAGVPLWNDANPLRPNTNCSGGSPFVCPTTAADSRCAVTINDNVRSSFSIGLPGLDADGKAKTIPNTGYVEILRTSNLAVWRTYNQPSVQAAVVPDLCAGTATSPLGWLNAVKFSSADSFPESTALKIGISTASISPGPAYLRKDFSVTKAGTYNLRVLADNYSDVYIDSSLVLNTDTFLTVFSANKSLSVGCHTIMIKLTNAAILVNPASLMFSLKASGSSKPLVVSDTTWRVSAGLQKHFSDVNYYADPLSWTVIRNLSLASQVVAGWTAASGDSDARYVSTTHSYDSHDKYPQNQFTLFRDNRTIELTESITAKITVICDDDCYPYLDGSLINARIGKSTPVSFTVTLTEGSHKFAFMVFNGSSDQAAFAFAAVDTSTGALITHTDTNWSAANFWSATDPGSSTSYDNSYKPNPDPLPEANISALAVGGGGGGGTAGGGGGGGVVSVNSSVGTGSYTVVVGPSGTGSSTNKGTNGGNSSFGAILAYGGGGGGGHTTVATPGNIGGSGGGGGLSVSGTDSAVGGVNFLGQGFKGGASFGYACSPSGGGGGAGAGGVSASSTGPGAGGIGLSSSISGSTIYYAGGGGGGSWCFGYGAGGSGGGGAGSQTTGTPGTANTGGGGGGGGVNGGTGGAAGGSGVVIISYPTGSMTATGGTVTSILGNTITVHTFTASGTFTVTSIQ